MKRKPPLFKRSRAGAHIYCGMRFEGTGKFEAGRVEVRTLTGVVINGKTLPGVLTTQLQPPRMMVVQYLSPLNAAARELVKAARAAAALRIEVGPT